MQKTVQPMPASQRAAITFARVIIAGSLLTLIGWLINASVLKSLVPGRVAMNPMTAVALLMAAVSLSLAVAARRRHLGQSLAMAVAALGAACVVCYWLGVDLRIDRILFAHSLGDNRMAPNTGACFFLAGIAVAALPHPRCRVVSQSLGSFLTCWTFVSVVGYVFGSRSFYGIGAYIPMALNTALMLNMLGLGIVLAVNRSWLASVIDTTSPCTLIARRLVPAAIAAPLLFGWLRLRGQAAGLFDTEFGAALLVVSTIVVSLLVIMWAVKSVERAMDASADAQRALHDRETQFRLLVAGIQDYAIFLLDRDGNVSTWNSGAQRIKGYQAAEIIGRHFSVFYPAQDLVQGKPVQELAQAAKEGSVRDEGWRVRKDGTQFWADTVITAMVDDDGTLTGFSKITRDMTAHREYQQRLSELNDDLERRVDLRTRELADANRDLAEKNRENETFVYSVSHDLRSPLVNLQGFSAELELTCREICETLRADDVPPAVRQRTTALINPGMTEPVQFIRTAVTRLSAIIDALLRLSRAGRIEYQIRDVHLDEVVRRIVDSMRISLNERGAEIILHSLPTVRGDATALEQVFANLIGNAVNYLDPSRPGLIEVGVLDEPAGSDSDLRTCFVRDNGLGIAAACHPKIFQAFQRLHPAAAVGEGMGLTIVRRVVERHGGRIWLESVENQGTTFFVSLPAAESPHARLVVDPFTAGSATETQCGETNAMRQEGVCHAN